MANLPKADELIGSTVTQQQFKTKLKQLVENIDRSYATLAEANADIANIGVGAKVDTDDNGRYYKATAGATTLTKSPYDPLTQAKADATIKANAAEANAKDYADNLNDLNRKQTTYLPDYSLSIKTTGYQAGLAVGYTYLDRRVKFKYGDDINIGIYHNFTVGGQLVFLQLTQSGGVSELYRHLFYGTQGSYSIKLSDISFDFSSIVGDIYIGIASNPTGIQVYSSGGAGNVYGYSYKDDTKVLVGSPNAFPYWITKTETEIYKDVIDRLRKDANFAGRSLGDVLYLNGLFEGKTYTTSMEMTQYLRSNMHYKGVFGQTRILFTGTGDLFKLNGNSKFITFEDIIFDGNTQVIAAAISAADVISLAGKGSNRAFYINGFINNIKFINCRFVNWNGFAMESTLTHQIYAETMKMSGNVFMYNYGGANFDVRSEYHQLSQNTFAYNMIGCNIEGGNNFGSTNHFNRNGVGLVLRGTSAVNDTHGSMSACTLNHNFSYSLFCIDVNNGYTLNGCHFYDGKIYLNNSRGVNIQGGMIPADIEIVNERVDGMNIISNNIFISNIVPIGSTAKLSMSGNKLLSGGSPSNINNLV